MAGSCKAQDAVSFMHRRGRLLSGTMWPIQIQPGRGTLRMGSQVVDWYNFLLLTRAPCPAPGPFSPLHTSYVGNNRLLIFQRGIKVIACCENLCWLCKSSVCPHFSSLGFLFIFIIFSVGTRLPRLSKDICPGFSSGVPELYLWIPPNKVQWESTDGQGDNFI